MAAAYVEEGFHRVLSKGKRMHLEKTPPPFEGWAWRNIFYVPFRDVSRLPTVQ